MLYLEQKERDNVSMKFGHGLKKKRKKRDQRKDKERYINLGKQG